MAEETTATIEVEVRVKTKNQNGELVDAIASSGKLTKADAGRTAAVQEDHLRITIEPGARGYEDAKVEIETDCKTANTDAAAA